MVVKDTDSALFISTKPNLHAQTTKEERDYEARC